MVGLIEFGSEKVFVKNYPKMSEDDYSGKYPGFEVIARRVFGRSSPLLGDIFGIWISDFRVLDFEEGGAAELGGGALVVGSVGTASRHCTLSAGEVSRLEGPCRSGLTGVACSSGRHSSQVIPQPGAGFDSFLGRKTLA